MEIIAYKYREYPQFSWSVSREKLFNKCKRKYYYQYYGSHNGWDDSADKRTRKIYRLKKLQSIYGLVGTRIHNLANDLVENGIDKNVQKYRQEINDFLNQKYKDSLNDNFISQWETSPNKYTVLKEIYLFDDLSDKIINKIKGKLDKCIPNLIESKTLEEVKEAKKYKIIEDVFNSTITFAGYKIFAIPDLIYQNKDNSITIVDWKSGRKNVEVDKKQLELYYYYFHKEYGSSGHITCRLEYLMTGESEEFLLGRDTVPEVEARIRESINKMSRYVQKDDLEKNQPLPETEYEPGNDNYLCANCKYQSVCSM